MGASDAHASGLCHRSRQREEGERLHGRGSPHVGGYGAERRLASLAHSRKNGGNRELYQAIRASGLPGT